RLRRTRDALPMAGAAGLHEQALAGGGQSRAGARTAGGARIGLDRQGRIVLARHGHLRDRRQVLPDGLQILGLFIDVLVLSLAGDHPRERENADRYGDQQADDEAESIEKMSVLLAHDIFRVGLPEKALCKSARKYIRWR